MAPQYSMEGDEEQDYFHDDHGNMDGNDDDSPQPNFPMLTDRTVSFNDRNHSSYSRSALYRRLLKASQKPEWAVVSPMTRHVFPSERHREEQRERKYLRSPVRLPRRRSRSFNDFIEHRDNDYEAYGIRPLVNDASTISTSPWKHGDKRKRHKGGATTTTTKDPDIATEKDDMPVYLSILYGAINCTIVLPVIMSFGNIIYRDDAFAEYMPVLIKLTLCSGLVHQLCFSVFSTLPFAVGSVQDAGLIFLSKMAHDMVVYCRQHNYNDEIMLATVTIGLGLAAALLGIGLIVIGKLGLASYVQLLPTCVVAGYLAFIGWFVGYSGLGIMAGASDLTPSLLWEQLLYVLPGVLGGAFIYGSVRTLRHVAVLPLCIMMLLVIFYGWLMVTGSTIEDATHAGWIRESQTPPAWQETWKYLQIEKVAWGAYPQLWLTWVGMLFVVALSSSLDVAAIELEVKQPLNYNKELGVVGVSNLISGLTGGYTGSYIFSQTIFSLRIGVRSRIPGLAIAFFCGLVIVVPFPVLSYVPNFFYGSLLSMICIDLMYEWLWEFREKVTTAEYLIGLSTFGLIQALGVEYGIVAGVMVYMVCRQLKINVGELKQVYIEEEEEEDYEEEDNGYHVGASLTEEPRDETSNLVTNGDEPESYITF